MPTHDLTPYRQIVEQFEPQSKLLDARPLFGGVSAQVTLLEVQQADGHIQKMIVRKHGARDLQANPQIAADEFKLLKLLQAVGIPAARPYYLDQSRVILPTPYVVVEYIEGDTEFAPKDVEGFVRQLAGYLALLHQVDISQVDVSFLPDQSAVWTHKLRNRPVDLDASINEGRIRDVLERVWPPAQHNPKVLLHGDFWPGNAIWREGELLAMIDWEDAAVGDPLWDLAVSRLDVLWTLGMEAMQTYTRLYVGFNPLDLRSLPYWDLCVALRPANQISHWAEDDVAKLRMRQRHHLFVAQALEALVL